MLLLSIAFLSIPQLSVKNRSFRTLAILQKAFPSGEGAERSEADEVLVCRTLYSDPTKVLGDSTDDLFRRFAPPSPEGEGKSTGLFSGRSNPQRGRLCHLNEI